MGPDVPHYNVVIATPGASMLPGYVRSLLKTIYVLDRESISWNYLTDYSSLVAHAREKTIGGTGYQDPKNSSPGHGTWTYDKIFWIDSDIAWEPDDFLRLLAAEQAIISGCYMLDDHEVTVYPKPLGPGMRVEEILRLKRPFVVRGAGFGFLAVRRGVFEQMARPWFSQVDVEITNEETGESEFKFPLMGEDLSWCEKARRLGFDVWVDPLVRLTHHRLKQLEWPR